jgi:hypothetical protein
LTSVHATRQDCKVAICKELNSTGIAGRSRRSASIREVPRADALWILNGGHSTGCVRIQVRPSNDRRGEAGVWKVHLIQGNSRLIVLRGTSIGEFRSHQGLKSPEDGGAPQIPSGSFGALSRDRLKAGDPGEDVEGGKNSQQFLCAQYLNGRGIPRDRFISCMEIAFPYSACDIAQSAVRPVYPAATTTSKAWTSP